MLESIVNEIKRKEEEANRKIMNAKLKADSIVKMTEKKRSLLMKKYGDEEKKAKESAENCLLLCCLSALGGEYDAIGELLTAQDSLGLGVQERFSGQELRETVERLQSRKVISSQHKTGKNEVTLPIFKDWLREYSELHL